MLFYINSMNHNYNAFCNNNNICEYNQHILQPFCFFQQRGLSDNTLLYINKFIHKTSNLISILDGSLTISESIFYHTDV